MNNHLAVLQGDLQRAVIQITEEEEPVGVPCPKLEAHRYRVVIGPTRQLQEAGGVKEDREGVGLHAGEGQVTLSRQRFRERETPSKRDTIRKLSIGLQREVKNKANPLNVGLHVKLFECFKCPNTLGNHVFIHQAFVALNLASACLPSDVPE